MKQIINYLFLALLLSILSCADATEEFKPSIFNADSLLREEVIFGNEAGLRPIFRCPSICITNQNTLLVACNNQQTWEDKDYIDILLARKEKGGEWHKQKIFESNNINGRGMGAIFLLDRANNRIYLFFSKFLDKTKLGYDHSSDEIDVVYVYSDDDGQSWSEQISLKELWNTNNYTAIISSASNGIVTKDGTFLVPTIVIKDHMMHSNLLIREENGKWRFSSYTPATWDSEATVYIDKENKIILDCRNVNGVRNKYCYDIDNDSFTQIGGNVINSYIDIKAEIVQCEWDGKSFYLMSYPDTQTGTRENTSLFGSRDGTNWSFLYRLEEGFNGAGYSNVAYFQGRAIVVYESLGVIKMIDFSTIMDDVVLTLFD